MIKIKAPFHRKAGRSFAVFREFFKDTESFYDNISSI